MRSFKKEKVIHGVNCPLPFLKIITPDPESCLSYWAPQSLVIKSRKLDGIGSFNPRVLSDVTAADSSELWLQRRDTHWSGTDSSSPLPGSYSCPAGMRVCFGPSGIWSKGARFDGEADPRELAATRARTGGLMFSCLHGVILWCNINAVIEKGWVSFK